MAGVQGFEPRLGGPKPPVLPLDDTPITFEVVIVAELNRFVKQKRVYFYKIVSKEPCNRCR